MNEIKISTRLLVLIGMLSSLLIGIGALGLFDLSKSRNALAKVHTEAMLPALMAGDIIHKMELNRLQVLLAFQHAPDSPMAAIHDHPISMHLDAINANKAAIARLLEAIHKAATTPEDKAAIAAVEHSKQVWQGKIAQTIDNIQAGDFSAAAMAAFLKAGREEGDHAVKTLVKFRDLQAKKADEAFTAAESSYQATLNLFLAAIFLGLLFAAWLGWATIRTLYQQLGCEPAEAADLARRVGEGHLNLPISLKPGDSTSLMAQLKTMRDKLTETVISVRQNSESVATASSQIAQGNNDLSQRTESQASALEQTAAAMEQLGAAVKQNAEHAHHANQLAQNASTVAIRGG